MKNLLVFALVCLAQCAWAQEQLYYGILPYSGRAESSGRRDSVFYGGVFDTSGCFDCCVSIIYQDYYGEFDLRDNSSGAVWGRNAIASGFPIFAFGGLLRTTLIAPELVIKQDPEPNFFHLSSNGIKKDYKSYWFNMPSDSAKNRFHSAFIGAVQIWTLPDSEYSRDVYRWDDIKRGWIGDINLKSNPYNNCYRKESETYAINTEFRELDSNGRVMNYAYGACGFSNKYIWESMDTHDTANKRIAYLIRRYDYYQMGSATYKVVSYDSLNRITRTQWATIPTYTPTQVYRQLPSWAKRHIWLLVYYATNAITYKAITTPPIPREKLLEYWDYLPFFDYCDLQLIYYNSGRNGRLAYNEASIVPFRPSADDRGRYPYRVPYEIGYEYLGDTIIQTTYFIDKFEAKPLVPIRKRYFNAQGQEFLQIKEIFKHRADTIRYYYNDAGLEIRRELDINSPVGRVYWTNLIDTRDTAIWLNAAQKTLQPYYPDSPYLGEFTPPRTAYFGRYTQEIEYLQFDERGNWIARKISNNYYKYESRRIEYW